MTKPQILPDTALVSKLIENDGRSWKADLVDSIFPPTVASSIFIVPSERGCPDRLVWYFDKKEVPHRGHLFAWKACQNAIPIGDNLLRRKISSQSSCPVCGAELEDVGLEDIFAIEAQYLRNLLRIVCFVPMPD
ncbi:hypothetical protein Salat_1901400 [Sesamum alatum]|uniref:Reverse transcriptase zinc-binding domain-containing protein n=1 Tax=Sesamum alatum TaxID=300844 RepID=A0AAE2CI99_9LAMI|nr:hypothetical protein Salat_1901400 [Sesamum alatum]